MAARGRGIYAGPAYVGKVGGGASHVTALGDTVNTAARLQSEAAAGEIVLGENLYASVATLYPGAEERTLNVRGKEHPLTVRALRPATL